MRFVIVSLAAAFTSACMAPGDHGGHANLVPGPALIHPDPGSEIPGAPIATDENTALSIVEVSLKAAPAMVAYLPGKPTAAWAYNGSVPGPTIEAKRGDEVVVHFTNGLPEPTTIHWHGVRVPNDMDGAGRLSQPIPPGGTFDYRFVVPDAGLFWYHPHVRSEVEVGRGLYGAIVVRDPSEPELDATEERVLVLGDVRIDSATGIADDHLDMRGMMMGREGNLVLVNGRPSNGTLTVARGQRTRLRLADAATARFFKLRFDGGTMTQIGSDGGLLAAPRPIESVLLVPGGRVDVVVETSAGGTLKMVPYERADGAGAGEELALLRLVPSDAATVSPAPLPAALRAIDALEAPAVTRTVELGERMSHGGWRFTIDDQTFPNVPPIAASLKTRMLLRVQNVSEMDHPFHVHGFFFQERGVPEWRDTINVPGMSTVELVVDFSERPGAAGDWMYHCHILQHAERGMMAEVHVR